MPEYWTKYEAIAHRDFVDRIKQRPSIGHNVPCLFATSTSKTNKDTKIENNMEKTFAS